MSTQPGAVVLLLAVISLMSSCGGPETSFPPPEAKTRENILAAFEAISGGRYAEHVRKNFQPDATLEVHGPMELAGTFTGHAEIIAGFDRVFAVVPVHAFSVEQIWVDNGPEEVTSAAIWTDAARLPTGEPLPTQGMNRIRVGPRGVIREDLFLTPSRVTLDLR